MAPISEQELKFQNEVRDPLGNELKALNFETNLHDMSSPLVGMNFLSVDPETVIVDERQTKLIKLLEGFKSRSRRCECAIFILKEAVYIAPHWIR